MRLGENFPPSGQPTKTTSNIAQTTLPDPTRGLRPRKAASPFDANLMLALVETFMVVPKPKGQSHMEMATMDTFSFIWIHPSLEASGDLVHADAVQNGSAGLIAEHEPRRGVHALDRDLGGCLATPLLR